jgi:hypothetical protein
MNSLKRGASDINGEESNDGSGLTVAQNSGSISVLHSSKRKGNACRFCGQCGHYQKTCPFNDDRFLKTTTALL